MDKNLLVAMIAVALTAIGMTVAAIATVARLWIKPLAQEIQVLKERLNTVETTVRAQAQRVESLVQTETTELSGQFQRLNERISHHIEDQDSHITRAWLEATAEWRNLITARFDKVDGLMLAILSKGKTG